jgi:hypothetical protein
MIKITTNLRLCKSTDIKDHIYAWWWQEVFNKISMKIYAATQFETLHEDWYSTL